MATVTSLKARHDNVIVQYRENEPFVLEVQAAALEELLPTLIAELELSELAIGRARAFLEDPVSVSRFCRRARFSLSPSLALIHATLSFRLVSSLSNLSPATLAPIYLTQPLFFFHPALSDRFGRPCAVLNLKHVARTADGELDSLKEFVRMGWEVGRRWMADSSKGKGKEGEPVEPKVQMVVIVDLEGAGMTNLEVELLPFFMDLLKSHFPGMVGAIFVLNYGWMYAGMWQLAKRILPNTALERILFPTKSELLQFFDVDHLLVEHGGTVSYEYTPANPILEKYCRPLVSLAAANAYPSPQASPRTTPHASPHSRNVSLESTTDIYHSAAATPASSRPPTPMLSQGVLPRRPSGLSMTQLNGPLSISAMSNKSSPAGSDFAERAMWRTASTSSLSNLRRIPSLVDFQLHLAETQAAIQSDSSGDEDDEEMAERTIAAREYARQMSQAVRQQRSFLEGDLYQEPDETPVASTSTSIATSVFSSRATSRAPSRSESRVVSRETSPVRRRDSSVDLTGTFASRAVKVSGQQPVSPYNVANPYYGYPAYVPPHAVDATGIPRPNQNRRRKRDLVRTLTYLAALRFLALHRKIQWQIAVLIRATLAVSELSKNKLLGRSKKKKSIRWDVNAGADGSTNNNVDSNRRSILGSTAPSPTQHHVRGVRVVYVLFLLILLRSPLISNLAAIVLSAPKMILPQALYPTQMSETILGAGNAVSTMSVRRKRDIVKRMLGFDRKPAGF